MELKRLLGGGATKTAARRRGIYPTDKPCDLASAEKLAVASDGGHTL